MGREAEVGGDKGDRRVGSAVVTDCLYQGAVAMHGSDDW